MTLHVEDKVKKVVVVVLFWKTKMAAVTTCEYAQQDILPRFRRAQHHS